MEQIKTGPSQRKSEKSRIDKFESVTEEQKPFLISLSNTAKKTQSPAYKAPREELS